MTNKNNNIREFTLTEWKNLNKYSDVARVFADYPHDTLTDSDIRKFADYIARTSARQSRVRGRFTLSMDGAIVAKIDVFDRNNVLIKTRTPDGETKTYCPAIPMEVMNNEMTPEEYIYENNLKDEPEDYEWCAYLHSVRVVECTTELNWLGGWAEPDETFEILTDMDWIDKPSIPEYGYENIAWYFDSPEYDGKIFRLYVDNHSELYVIVDDDEIVIGKVSDDGICGDDHVIFTRKGE